MNSGSFLSHRSLSTLTGLIALLSGLAAQANTSVSYATGGTVRLTVTADGTEPFYYQWRKDGVDIPGARSATYAVVNAQSGDTGIYTASVTNALGSTVSDSAFVSVGVSAPAFATQPVSQTIDTGAATTLSAAVADSASTTYQWQKNGVSIAGATNATLTLNGITQADAGAYTVVATTSGGSAISSAAILTVRAAAVVVAAPSTPAPSAPPAGVAAPAAPAPSATISYPAAASVASSRLVNVSIRTIPGTGAQTLIVGFVTAGNDKSILVRGVGPGLAPYTASATLATPSLELYDGSETTPIATNAQWGGTTQLRTTFDRLGAFALADQSKDAAILATLAPRVYSAQLKGDGQSLAIAEIYDADSVASPTGRIVNLSARTQVNTGDGVLIAGFVIAGNAPKRLLIRAVGPTLGTYGVSGALADPQLDLFVAGNSTPIQSNDNWNGTPELAAAFSAAGAFSFADSTSKDAAMIVTLNPGAYSAKVSGVGDTTGVALIEIYELP